MVKGCSLVEPLGRSQRTLCKPICGLDTAAGVDVQCLEDVNEPVRNAIVFQNFSQGWPVYTVKGLLVIDEVNDGVLLMV